MWSTVSFCPVAKHLTWRVTNVTQKIQKTVRVQSYYCGYIQHYKLFNFVYSYFCATSWIYVSEMRKVLLYRLPRVLYHFAPCMGQNDTDDHTFLMVGFKHLCHCSLYFFLPSCSQYLTVYYTSKSNKIYSVIKTGEKNKKKWIILPRSPLSWVKPVLSGQSKKKKINK